MTLKQKIRTVELMRKKFFNERGAIPVGIAVLLLVTSLVGLVAGYKAVQTPTKTKSQATSCATFTEVRQNPVNLNAGDSFTCLATLNSQFANSRTIACGWSKNGGWPQTGGRWDSPRCDGVNCSFGIRMDNSIDSSANYELVAFDNASGCGPSTGKRVLLSINRPSGPPPTQPPLPPGSGRCFYLTAQFNKTQDGDFDAWVSFNSDDTSGFNDIQLFRNDAYVAGYNRWNKANGPFTYEPGQYTGGRIPAGSTIKFSGRDDNCGDRGNYDSIDCTLNADGSVTSITPNRCFRKGGLPPALTATRSPQTTTPPVVPTNTPVPPSQIPLSPTPSPMPACGISLNSECCYSGTPCRYPLVCKYVSGKGNICVYPPEIDCGYEGLDCCPPEAGQDRCKTSELECSHNKCVLKPTATPRPTVTPVPPCGAYIDNYCCLGMTCSNPTLECRYSATRRTMTCQPRAAPTAPPGETCGHLDLECCQIGSQCHDPILKCENGFCRYNPPTRTSQLPNIIQKAVETVNQLFVGKSAQPAKPSPTSLSGKVRVNNSTFASVEKVMVTLYSDKEASENSLLQETQVNLTNKEGTFEFGNLENKEYYLVAFARTSGNEVYSSEKATAKVGQKVNLTINIGEQGLRYAIKMTQELGTTLRTQISGIPVVGPFIEMFIISAF